MVVLCAFASIAAMGDAVKANIPATIADMTFNDLRKLHEAAWNRLFALVGQRNKLLRQLGTMAQYAGDFTPATAMFMEFDFGQARDILAKVQEITPTIYAAIEEVNGYAKLIGKPVINRQRDLPL